MARKLSPKKVLIACQMSFDGKGNREIAKELGTTPATVSGWRRLEIWQEFEAQLIDAYKEQVLNLERGVIPSDVTPS